MKNNII